jgi:hypothetical protein
MKTFTVRDLDRKPSAVLDASEKEGVVYIERRDGRRYTIVPEGRRKTSQQLPDFRARMKAAGIKPMSREAARLLDSFIAGE